MCHATSFTFMFSSITSARPATKSFLLENRDSSLPANPPLSPSLLAIFLFRGSSPLSPGASPADLGTNSGGGSGLRGLFGLDFGAVPNSTSFAPPPSRPGSFPSTFPFGRPSAFPCSIPDSRLFLSTFLDLCLPILSDS